LQLDPCNAFSSLFSNIYKKTLIKEMNMVDITAALVKELREKTSAGMMDCKKALVESDGDIASAADWLRTKGLSAAAKKSGRIASEGLIGMAVNDTNGALIEVNSETDFVSRNKDFQEFVNTTSMLALESNSNLEALNTQDYPGTGRSVGEELTFQISTIGENMSLRRVETLSVENGTVASYMHNTLTPTLGKIGVLVALCSEADLKILNELGKQIAMHIAATKPLSVSKDTLDTNVIEKERNFLIEQARESGKPEDIIEKMLEGRMRKFFEEVCLMDQTFVIDGENKVRDIIEMAAKKSGKSIELSDFRFFVLGEGIEKKDDDFAAEVAAVAGN
jgi:elongation factor Ts